VYSYSLSLHLFYYNVPAIGKAVSLWHEYRMEREK
jgi:hypothetical protein